MRTRSLAAALLSLAAAGLVPAAASAAPRLPGDPELGAPAAFLPASGADAGRLVIDVPVRYADLPARTAEGLDEAAAKNIGQLRLRVSGPAGDAAATDTSRLLLSAPGPGVEFVHRVALTEAQTRDVLGDAPGESGELRLALAARQGLDVNGGRAEDRATDAEAATVAWRRAGRLPELPAPRCVPFNADVNFERPEPVVVACMGEDVDLRIARRPRHGTLRAARDADGVLRAWYRPRAGYVGPDRIVVAVAEAGAAHAAAGPAATARLDVQPFKLRALGDSIASGWGIYGDGDTKNIVRIGACRPKAAPSTNACSANSTKENRDAASGKPIFQADYGFANGSAWPAQVARRLGLSGPGQFQNLAVAGAHAEDWDEKAPYRYLLDGIVKDSPDLVLMSLGANPLLSTVLIGQGATCAFKTGQDFQSCIDGYIAPVRIRFHMANILTDLVQQARDADVVLVLYHTAVPALATFRYYQSEWILRQVNQQLYDASQDARKRLGPEASKRLKLMLPPRFNVGMPLRDVNGKKIGRGGDYECGSTIFTKSWVDGPSRQAYVSQTTLRLNPLNTYDFCSSDYLSGDKRPYMIEGDLGIHLSKAGAEFIAENVLKMGIRKP